MRMRKYVLTMASMWALSGSFALAQSMPQQRDPTGAPTQQQPTTSTQSQAPAATGDVQAEIQSALQKDPTLASSNINVQVNGQNVELSGTVASKDAKDNAEQIAKTHSGGLNVKNHIKVSSSGPGQSDNK